MTRPLHRTGADCPCQWQPICDVHRAEEWGGGEPDKCQKHGHGLNAQEQEARLAIASVMDTLTPQQQGRVARFLVWQQSLADERRETP